MQEWSPFRAYASRRRRFSWQDALTLFILFAGASWLYLATRQLPAYSWSWQSCMSYIIIFSPQNEWKAGLLLQGLFSTLRTGCWTFIFSLVVGGLAGLYAVHKPVWISMPYQFIINILRDSPPLVLLFCLYFFIGNVLNIAAIEEAITKLPSFAQYGISIFFAPPGQMDRMLSAVLALGLYQSAYVAEIIRGSMENISMGQWDAGLALGFSRSVTLWLIILPQGMRSAIAPLTTQCISTFKESSLASLISVPDLTFQSLEIMATSGKTFEIWICAASLYLLLGLLCAGLGKMLEHHYSHL